MRICLNMIVKNEAAVIARCLASVKPFIDHWVIVDTGSSDGTQDIVRQFMRDVPGELHERPWKNFAHNRNEALDLAREHGDYVLFIDADEMLRVPADWQWPAMNADAYQFRCEYAGWQYLRNAMVATRLPWRWVGVLHEYLTSDAPHRWATLPGPAFFIQHDGARGRDPQTYLRDIEVLEQALRDEPDNTRYVFYLAQSYRDAGRLDQAVQRYRQRAAMPGWEEEGWFAQFQVAVLRERMGAMPGEVRDLYLEAFQRRPSRAEPLCELARYHRLRNDFALAFLYARQAAATPLPADGLFIDSAVYAWRSLDELSVAAFYIEQDAARAEGRAALDKLWRENRFPESERARMLANRAHYGLGSASAAPATSTSSTLARPASASAIVPPVATLNPSTREGKKALPC
jgi:tetratricopeptide (TPR) repeat protein